MGLPQRASDPSQRATARYDDDDPVVSVQDWFDEEESGPWCVDRGAAIQVMTSRAIYDAVAEGELSPDMKVWRDGRACWLPIAECHELTVAPARRRQNTPLSGVRRVRPRTASFSEAPADVVDGSQAASRRPEDKSTLMLTTSFAVGVIIGALLYLPFAW